MFAEHNGYDAKEIYREWYDLHPNLKPSAKRNMADETKRELDDAIIWINPFGFFGSVTCSILPSRRILSALKFLQRRIIEQSAQIVPTPLLTNSTIR